MGIKSTSEDIYEIGLKKISEITPHEEYIPRHASKIARELLKYGRLIKPILVEERHNIILDGTHRYIAFKRLGIKYIPAILVSYKRDDIQIDRWIRIFKDIDLKPIREKFDAIEIFKDSKYDPKENIGVYIVRQRMIYHIKIRDGSSVENVVKYIERVNGEAMVGYSDSSCSIEDECVLLDYTPPTKDEVIRKVRMGEKYPPKYTRHIINIPGIDINVPLNKLLDYKTAISYLNKLNYIF